MRSSTGSSARASSPVSRRTAAALVCSLKASTVTAGTPTGSSSRKRYCTSTIDSFLERRHADPAIGVEEALLALLVGEIDVGGLLDCVDDAVLAEARAGDLAERRIRALAAAEQ